MHCKDIDHARTLGNNSGWQKVGPYRLLYSPWRHEEFHSEQLVPSYGGWIKVCGVPIDKWNLDSFRFIGDACGGLLEVARKTLATIDLIEISIKVRSNELVFYQP